MYESVPLRVLALAGKPCGLFGRPPREHKRNRGDSPVMAPSAAVVVRGRGCDPLRASCLAESVSLGRGAGDGIVLDYGVIVLELSGIYAYCLPPFSPLPAGGRQAPRNAYKRLNGLTFLRFELARSVLAVALGCGEPSWLSPERGHIRLGKPFPSALPIQKRRKSVETLRMHIVYTCQHGIFPGAHRWRGRARPHWPMADRCHCYNQPRLPLLRYSVLQLTQRWPGGGCHAKQSTCCRRGVTRHGPRFGELYASPRERTV